MLSVALTNNMPDTGVLRTCICAGCRHRRPNAGAKLNQVIIIRCRYTSLSGALASLEEILNSSFTT